MGIIEGIPREVASKLLGVLTKKTVKLGIVSTRMLGNTVDIINNTQIIMNQLFYFLVSLMYILKPYISKSKKKPRDKHSFYLENAQQKKRRRSKKKKKSKKKKSKKKKAKKKKSNKRKKSKKI